MPASVFPTGVTLYDPERAHNSFILYGTTDVRSILLDMNGNEVHGWPLVGFPTEMIDPADNAGRKGDIIVQKEPDIFANETLLIVDWRGDAVWEWGSRAPGGGARQNHDQAPLPNGNILVLAHREPPRECHFPDQAIYEVTRGGDIVWRWLASEHIEECGFEGERREMLLSPTGRPRSSIFVINDMHPLGPNRWFDAGDDRFHPDNVMIDSREGSFIAIIDKASGTVVWLLGPEYAASYDNSKKTFGAAHGFPRPIDSISGPHDAHMIGPGLPGAGNVMVFDNQGAAGFPPIFLEMFPGSRVLEIDPLTEEIVWQYDASCSGQPFWRFFSSFISSARRLPSGNTLICEGMNGRIFQVTPAGDIVWEFINPHSGDWADHDVASGGRTSNWVFRAQPIPYDWVPEGTPASETPVVPPDNAAFRLPQS